MNPIIKNYEDYDAFLESVLRRRKKKDRIYYALYSVRALYSIHAHKKEYQYRNVIKLFLSLLKNRIVFFLTIPLTMYYLSQNDKKSIIFYTSSYDDVISDRMDIPVSHLLKRYAISMISKNMHIYIDLFIMSILILQSKLNRRLLIMLLNQTSVFLLVYEKIDFLNIQNIIIESDNLPEGYSIIKAAKRIGIKTIKIDHFFIDDISHNNIFCDYYFYPNNYHRNLAIKFPYNKSIKFVKGGFPAWDVLADYKRVDSGEKSKVIAYLTQHGVVDQIQPQYIMDLVGYVESHAFYKLIIKVHPYDTYDYKSFESERVQVLSGKGKVNYELISKADFVLSICSVMSLEAKHSLKNSYFINYDVKNSKFPIDYQLFEEFIPTISSKEMLFDALDGNFQVPEIDLFIQNFNATFPSTCNQLKELWNECGKDTAGTFIMYDG